MPGGRSRRSLTGPLQGARSTSCIHRITLAFALVFVFVLGGLLPHLLTFRLAKSHMSQQAFSYRCTESCTVYLWHVAKDGDSKRRCPKTEPTTALEKAANRGYDVLRSQSVTHCCAMVSCNMVVFRVLSKRAATLADWLCLLIVVATHVAHCTVWSVEGGFCGCTVQRVAIHTQWRRLTARVRGLRTLRSAPVKQDEPKHKQ